MRSSAIVGVILFLLNSGASAGHLTYSQWAALDDDQRAVYVGSAIKMLTGFAPDIAASKQEMHYRQCVLEGEMTNVQLSNNVLTFGRSFPDVQNLSAQGVLAEYLNRLCGLLE